ncbi:uncharacterized protein C15orf39 homolog [Guaruba guarouba]
MASKRDVEPLDPVIFMKLPRLEQDPSASFPTGRGKPRSKTHFNYKGSYFACPLQSPNGPKPPHVHQSPEPPNLHYSTGAGSQPVLVEGSGECCPPNPTESMGPGMQPPAGAETGRDRLMPEPMAAREKWGSAGPGHPFLAKQPVAVKRAPTLAAPKPMYRAPAYFTDPRVAQPLQQRPGNAGWAVPVASHPSHPGEHRRGPHADPSLPPLHHLMALQAREKMGSPAAFSPYYTAFEQYRSPPTSPFPDAGLCSQRKVPETHRPSLDPWHKLCLPATSPVYQERPPECYPSLHKAPLFLPPLAPHMEAQSCAYRSFGFEGSRVPYTSAYLKPQAPWRYFRSPSDTYVPRAASASVGASPPPKPAALLRDAEPSRQEGYVLGSSFAFSPGGTAVSSTSRACMEPGCEQHQAEGPCWPVVVRHSSTLQPVCPQEKVPGASGGIPEAFPKGERCLGKQEPANPERRVSLTPQETPHEGPRALITIGEGDTCKVKDAAKDLISPSPPASLPVGAEDPWDSEVPPPSPPMPVINKVFSLASYGDDLEGPEGSATFCREHLWGDTAPLSMGGSREPTVAVPTTSSQALVHSVVLQSQGESGHRRVPEEPPPVPPQLGSEDSSEEEALDLSLKKRAMGQGESPWVLDGEGGKEEKDAERKVGEGEGTKLQKKPFLLRVFWDKGRFRSSTSFMVGKIIPSPFSTIPALSSTTPAPSSTIPTQPSSTIPALSIISPTQPSSTIPALSIISPTQPSSTIPALSIISPTQPSSTIPLPSSAIPAPPSSPQGSPAVPCSSSPPASPRPSPLALGEERPALPAAGQYFTTLHAWLCDVLSYSVARSSPQLLREWLKKAEAAEQPGEAMPKCPLKAKNDSRVPEHHKAAKGKEIWLAFQDVPALLANLLSQLETFMFACKCPFPHVVRAGAVFIPIHVVKKQLFPKLPGVSVDQVLQEHRVELRPTTLSEERHLRDLELKGCTSRMLKLLALKQLTEIYPDLLNLHWHNSIKQQLRFCGHLVPGEDLSWGLVVEPGDEKSHSEDTRGVLVLLKAVANSFISPRFALKDWQESLRVGSPGMEVLMAN